MSNDIDEGKQSNDPSREAPEKETWQQIQQDLRSALDSWTEMTQRPKAKKSPEEQQLEDMKRLLANLKSKIREFEEG
jgi:hypothetical protein